VETQIRVQLARINASPPLRALSDVTLVWQGGEVTIRRCAVFEKRGELPWVSFPRLPIQREGGKSFAPIIDLPRELRKRIFAAILDEYRRKSDLG
jgi:DNA-binding cell septation regulator SpoVG